MCASKGVELYPVLVYKPELQDRDTVTNYFYGSVASLWLTVQDRIVLSTVVMC